MHSNEHMLFYDIPFKGKKWNYHSVVLTTYAIDLIHFDNQVRNTLHRKQVSSISVLADSSQIDNILEYASPQFLSHTGKDYSITNIGVKNGVYHPKISFFVGYDSVLVLIGSGNLTVTGHGKNHEAFTGFMIDPNNVEQRPLIEECWCYIKKFVNQDNYFEKRRILCEIPENCRFLEDAYDYIPHAMHTIGDELQAALLYNEKKYGILSQITDIVPMGDVRNITVLSPYFDKDGATLQNILNLCPKAKMDVLIQNNCLLSPDKMPYINGISFYDFNETERGKVEIKGYKRLAHAKIYVFETSTKKYCIVGSANATKAGFGTLDGRGVNEELCVLYASSKRDFLLELGLKPSVRCDIPQNNVTFQSTLREQNLVKPVRLLCAIYENNSIKIVAEDFVQKNVTVIIDDGVKLMSFDNSSINNRIITIEMALDKRSALCYICNKEGQRLSNKVFVNHINELDITNPSPKFRELHRIINKIETEEYNSLEIAKMITDVMCTLSDGDTSKEMVHIHSDGGNVTKKNKELPDIKFNPEFDNDDRLSYSRKIDRGMLLIDCIEDCINKKLKALDDEIKDEEEDGNSETSRPRASQTSDSILIHKDNVKVYAKRAQIVLKSYENLILRKEIIYIKNDECIQKEDLSLFALSLFVAAEICYLNRFKYVFASQMEKSHYQKMLFDSLDHVIECEGIKVLERFSSFCCKCVRTNGLNSDVINMSQKAMKYMLLFVMFYDRFSPNKIYNEKKIKKAVDDLVMIWGLPEKKRTEKELEPLIENYDHVFEFRYVEQALKRLGYIW